MPCPDLTASVLSAWQTSNRVTISLMDMLPRGLWAAEIPGIPRRTIRLIGAHLHNSRRAWIRTLGREHGIPVPDRVDPRAVTRRQLVAALSRSSKGMEALLRLAFASGGTIPPSKGYVWRNLALDAGHVLSYFVAHEAHHRGQIVMAARQLGVPLGREVAGRLWWWKPPVRRT